MRFKTLLERIMGIWYLEPVQQEEPKQEYFDLNSGDIYNPATDNIGYYEGEDLLGL